MKEDESFIILQADWNAELPYYSERKAVMIPGWFKHNQTNIDELKNRCSKIKIAGVAILGDIPTKGSESYQLINSFGFNPDSALAISQEGYWWHWYGK